MSERAMGLGGAYDPDRSKNPDGSDSGQRSQTTFSGLTNLAGQDGTPMGSDAQGNFMGGTIKQYQDPNSGLSNELAFGGDTRYAGQQADESRRLAGFYGNQKTPDAMKIAGQDRLMQNGLLDAQQAAQGNWNSGGQRALQQNVGMANSAMAGNAASARGGFAARAGNRQAAAAAIGANNTQGGLMGQQLYAQEQLQGMQNAGQMATQMRGLEDARVNMIDQANTRQLGQNTNMNQFFTGREAQMNGRDLQTGVARQGFIDQNKHAGYAASQGKNAIDRGASQAQVNETIGAIGGGLNAAATLGSGLGQGGQPPGLGAAQPAPGPGYQPGKLAIDYGTAGYGGGAGFGIQPGIYGGM